MKRNLLQKIFDELKQEGHRLTHTRKQLFEFIILKKGHWTIQDLGEEIKQKFPKIGIATVYRTIHLLLKKSLLNETQMGSNASRYEVAPQHHHDHLICNTCGKILEFENEKIESLQKEVATALGFELKDHRMELYGDCLKPRCKGKLNLE